MSAGTAAGITGTEPQQELLQHWLKLAPGPPERGVNQYDTFISYRSADRGWAMALYDALRLAGWKPFLDQFELVPGTSLQTSLEEALEASSSGVILWSSRTKDSEWCRRERQSMLVLGDANQDFHYLFAKLDAEPLPLFARTDLYVGFEDSPEGPRGANLLRIMYGLRGLPLSREAVQEAERVDQGAKQILIQIKAAIEGDNPERLLKIALSSDPGLLAGSGPLTQAVRGLISMGRREEALGVLDRAETYFPKSIVLKQLRGLALRRLGRHQDAIDVLSELKAAGHQDPETLGILAASWYVRYTQSGKLIDLRRSRELYRTAFQADPKSYYAGINAASKSLFLSERDEAERLLALVLPLVEKASDGEDLWAAVTLGEAYLLKGDVAAAAKQYQTAVDCHPGMRGDLGSTRTQAKTIAEFLKLSEEQAKQVLAPFDLLS